MWHNLIGKIFANHNVQWKPGVAQNDIYKLTRMTVIREPLCSLNLVSNDFF